MIMKKQDFGDVVNTLTKAGIIDGNYPVKGCYVWLPYGFELKEKVFSHIEEVVKGQGYQRYQFPRLIPGQAIRKVTKEVADFEDGLFWLRKKDGTNLDLFLNPTGECGVYTMFKKWIRQETDLPLRLYQIGNTFRPHKRPNVMLNGDELTNLLEAHSAFSSKEEADREFLSTIESFKEIHKAMGLPFLALRRPILGNKPVCIDMVSFETYLPSKNTSFNVGVLYNQGQIYSRAFDVIFSDQNGQKDNTHQVTFGISERGLAAMLDLHIDEYGIRLLPAFAPLQIMIIPVYGNDDECALDEYAHKIKGIVKGNYSVAIDSSNKNAGKKFAIARQQGVPVRLGISKYNRDNETVRVYIRTEEEPLEEVPLKSLDKVINDSFPRIQNKLFEDADAFLNSKTFVALNLDEVYESVEGGLIAKMYWCGGLSCLSEMNEKLPGELIGTQFDLNESGSCFVCGKESSSPSYYAKRGASP